MTNPGFDQFYPPSETMSGQSPFWQIGMVAKLADHRAGAEAGDRDKESRLCNRLGQLRRLVKREQMLDALREEVEEAVKFLRSTGRTVDFKQEDPAKWITTRDGRPRW